MTQEGQEGIHHSALSYRGRDYSYIQLWDLATTEKAGEEDAGRMSGLWRPTPLGIRFATNLGRVYSHVQTYDNEVVGYAGGRVSVVECLGKHFNYRELMGEAPA